MNISCNSVLSIHRHEEVTSIGGVTSLIPISILQDLIQAGLFKADPKNGDGLKFQVSDDLKVYAIIALPLITVTMTAYLIVEHRQRYQRLYKRNGNIPP